MQCGGGGTKELAAKWLSESRGRGVHNDATGCFDSLRQRSLSRVWNATELQETRLIRALAFSSSDEASPDVKVECLACLIQLASTCFSANPAQ